MYPITEKLETSAQAVIDGYLALPIGARPPCPYFNNRRRRARGGLRALAGKGSPEDIVEEASLRGIQTRTSLDTLDRDALTCFLVDNGLGIDCSGFAYHVLSALVRATKNTSLARALTFHRSGVIGKLIARMRPAENADVATFRLDRNSAVIASTDARPGDIITFMRTGRDKTYNHILVITAVERTDKTTILSYAHSYAWPTDGTYHHGVRTGTILFSTGDNTDDNTNNILHGTWIEQDTRGPENFTHKSALDAEEVSLRRLHILK